ncbi:MAG TPA: S1C family serine protease [Bryobacteraceae bacterium]|jgi:S1-C subfamily serine protease|nr:S1C family serine protease [Bryobacteraceae bacterium]
MENALVALSDELAAAVERAGRSVVTVHARPRLASSGVHWRQGVIVTAEHTVKHDEEITVGTADGGSLAATLVGRDPGTDLAVLKVEGITNPTVDFSDLPAQTGRLALAVGRAPDSGVNATMGVISAVSGPWRTWRGGMMDQYIRLDLTLYPGSSGGAVINTQGEALGIATSGLSRLAGLAVPLSTVNRIVGELLTRGHIARGYLGLGLQPVTIPDPLVKQLHLAGAGGVIVLSVEPGGPSERAGLLMGDILVALDGKPVADTDDVQSVLEPDYVGRSVKASLVRAGALADAAITIGERPRRAD